MAQYRIWYSTESFADYIIDHTTLRNESVIKKKLYESDANNSENFHALPDHIKKILYLDAPDLIVEIDMEPIFSIEVTTEAGTGHNAFQRFARIAAAVENGVPAIYIYPEAVIINRKSETSITSKWDSINPLIFQALKGIRSIYHMPALLFYFPSYYSGSASTAGVPSNAFATKGLKYDSNIFEYASCPDSSSKEMIKLFGILDLIIAETKSKGVIKGRDELMSRRDIMEHVDWMDGEFFKKSQGSLQFSPVTATRIIDTQYLLNYLGQYSPRVSELLRSRPKTMIYQVNAAFRGDPYPGALAALDYLLCREGKTFEERKYNLVLCWGIVDCDDNNKSIKVINGKSSVGKIASVDDFVSAVKKSNSKNMLNMDYPEIRKKGISRYYMQVRYGSMFSKNKEIRVFSYFADAILFCDGALWREG